MAEGAGLNEEERAPWEADPEAWKGGDGEDPLGLAGVVERGSPPGFTAFVIDLPPRETYSAEKWRIAVPAGEPELWGVLVDIKPPNLAVLMALECLGEGLWALEEGRFDARGVFRARYRRLG